VNAYAALVLGIVFAGVGGDLFVRGTVGIARWLRIAPGIIGATVAAFATSSPELAVAVRSALAGGPEISLGNALGANVVNVALILGIGVAISGIHCPPATVRRDFPVAMLVPVVTGVLVLLDGVVSRLDGLLLLAVFVAWLAATIVEARRQRSAVPQDLGERRIGSAALASGLGLAFLGAAGELIVRGATGIAAALGIEAFVIGATVVAIGTTAPELATMIVAKLRKHDEVGLGTVLGSNIFNGLFVVGVAATIHPITVAWREITVALVFGLGALAFVYPTGKGFIERRRGILLLALYAVYLATIFQYGTA